jgi:4-cresol dehydrogenase (hydroxylating)
MPLAHALSDWRNRLGADRVRDDADTLARYGANVSGFRRRITAVLLPRTTEDVQAAVGIATREGAPLYPISRGANWGLGSRLPVRDGCAVLDLSGMDRIREIHAARRYAVIEAGVTQGRLSDELLARRIPLIVNVTGSGRETSLIGNALDRGVGYFAPRARELSGLEVVLPSGALLRTGFARFDGAQTAYLFRDGVGPSLDGLFFQSGLGVVTAAGLELHPLPECPTGVIARVARDGDLARTIDAIAQLRRRGVISSVAHVGNRARSLVTLAPLVFTELRKLGWTEEDARLRKRATDLLEGEGFGPWSAVLGYGGPPAQRRWIRAEIRRALGSFTRLLFLSDRQFELAERVLSALAFVPVVRTKLAMLRAAAPFHHLALGRPTDAALASVFWPLPRLFPAARPMEPDASEAGLLYTLPLLPAEGAVARACADGVERICARYGFTPLITFNPIDDRAMESVISFAFDRADAGQADAARACLNEAEAWFVASGWPPYRVNVDAMGGIVRPDCVFDQTVADLARALDPGDILAPGRYRLPAGANSSAGDGTT